MKKIVFGLFLLCFGVFFGCNKVLEEKTEYSSSCHSGLANFQLCNCSSTSSTTDYYSNPYQYVTSNESKMRPKFNPNNDNEFVYVQNEDGEQVIYLYNRGTSLKSLVFKGAVFGVPMWTNSNWIVFTRGYSGIYRVRPDGTNLSLFISYPNQFSPNYNSERREFLTYHGFRMNQEHSAKIWDEKGILVDSIDLPNNPKTKWLNSSFIASVGGLTIEGSPTNALSIIKPDSKQLKMEYYFPLLCNHGASSIPSSFAWLNNDELLFVDGPIYKLNVMSSNVEILYCGCDETYLQPSVNASGTKVLLIKMDFEVTSPDIMTSNSEIVMFDLLTNTFEDIIIE